MADREGGEWLEAHEYRAELIAPLYYALAALAVISILLPFKWPGSGIPSALVTLVLATGCAGAGAWVGYAGGKIRHTEFRNGPAPAIHSETDHDPD